MKRFLTILLAAVFVLIPLAGCSDAGEPTTVSQSGAASASAESGETTVSPTTAPVEPTPTETPVTPTPTETPVTPTPTETPVFPTIITSTPTETPMTVTPTETPATPTPTETPVTPTPTETPATPTPTETQVTLTPTETPEPTFAFSELQPVQKEKKEHQTLEEVPAYATLVGSDTLPPIDNQGQIGSCQSQSVAYMQLTNAVAQYMKAAGTLGDWNPSKNRDSCYSPKFTYQFCGASTTNVYIFLQDQGALTYAQDPYVKDGDSSVYIKNGKFQTDTAKWPTSPELYTDAMSVRITNYEQTYVTSNPLYTASGKNGVNMSTEAGQAMLRKIKEAVATGNVVVTGGYPNTWNYVTLTQKSGNLGKRGDSVITFATNDRSGGHNVSIVGYDDDLEVTANGITTKGAFLIANSWGKSYGRNGYTWITYDALNSVSDYEEFTLPAGLAEGVERDWPLDQFCFIYWDSDLLFDMPQLYAEIEVTVANRDAMTVELSRTDVNGQTETFTPSMFAFREMHEKYDVTGYLNPAGEINGAAVDFGFTVNFDPLLKNLPQGCTPEDYLYGISVRAFDNSAELTIRSITLKNAAGQTLRSLTFPTEEDVPSGAAKSFTFSLGEGRRESFLDGTYIFRSAESGQYVVKSGVVGLGLGKEKDAFKLTVTFDSETNLYMVSRSNDGFVLDFKDGIAEGSEVQFNKQLITRTGVQTLHVSYVDGGSVCFFAVDEAGVNYALCFIDGKLKLTRAEGVEQRFCFEVLEPKTTYGDTTVEQSEGAVRVSGTTNVKTSVAYLALIALSDNSMITEKTVSVTSRAYEEVFDLPQSGVYMIEVLDDNGKFIGSAFIFEVKAAQDAE